MSSKMWSRDHSETGRHSPSSNSHHSSIIHALIFISGMKTFILKRYSFFMSRSSIWLILFWQKKSASPALCGNFLYVEWVQGFEVKTSSCSWNCRRAYRFGDQRRTCANKITSSNIWELSMPSSEQSFIFPQKLKCYFHFLLYQTCGLLVLKEKWTWWRFTVWRMVNVCTPKSFWVLLRINAIKFAIHWFNFIWFIFWAWHCWLFWCLQVKGVREKNVLAYYLLFVVSQVLFSFSSIAFCSEHFIHRRIEMTLETPYLLFWNNATM